MCPNLRSLSSNDWTYPRGTQEEFVEIAGMLSGLEHFDLQCWWTIELLERVLQLMPQLRSLGMRGVYSSRNLLRLIPLLQQFKSLQKLHLLHALDLGRALAADYSTSLFFGHFRRPAGQRGIAPAQEIITRLFFKNLKVLQELP